MGKFLSKLCRGPELPALCLCIFTLSSWQVIAAEYGGPREMDPAAKEVRTDRSKFGPDQLTTTSRIQLKMKSRFTVVSAPVTGSAAAN